MTQPTNLRPTLTDQTNGLPYRVGGCLKTGGFSVIPNSNGWYASMVTITPTMASEMLTYNTQNRKIRRGTLRKYAKAMKRGDWVVTPEPIVFDRDGILANGQHRLLAIVQAGCPQQLFVCINVDQNVFSVLDRGAVRTVADSLHLAQRHAEIAKIMNMVMYPSLPTSQMRDDDIDDMATIIADAYTKLHDFCAKRTTVIGSSPIRTAAALRLMSGADSDYVLNLYKTLADLDYPNMNPFASAFNKAIQSGSIATGGGRAGQLLMLVRGWDLFDPKRADQKSAQCSGVEAKMAQIKSVIEKELHLYSTFGLPSGK